RRRVGRSAHLALVARSSCIPISVWSRSPPLKGSLRGLPAKLFAPVARYSAIARRPFASHQPMAGSRVASSLLDKRREPDQDIVGILISGRSHAMTKFLQATEAANPFAFMRRVTEELDRTFGLRAEVPGLPAFYPRMWAPEIEVFERDQKFVVRVDL